MKHVFRFFGRRLEAGNWQIDPEELKHLGTVLRLKKGDRFEIFDGNGYVVLAELTTVAKKDCEFRIIRETHVPREPYDTVLFIGALKVTTLNDLLPSLVELGASKIFFFRQRGTEKARTSQKVADKVARIVTSALKQCKTSYRPEVCFLPSHASALRVCEELGAYKAAYFTAAGAHNLPSLIASYTDGPLCLFVGGEMGWHDEELDTMKEAGFTDVSLGPGVLRATTAAIAVCAAVRIGLSSRDPN